MKPVSDVVDLCDRDGRHVHSKVMVFGVTLAVWLTVVVHLFRGARPLAWSEVAVLVALLLAPYGLDGWKVLVKLRYGQPPEDPDATR
jgi:hypothetical protein